ncbi:hypothetical protein MKW98_022105 [Papaver atlanticum]|uniref:Histone deacetylase interacting domain-containing protein n=1 Tax=Papaver atlanticum TaxID=357466 RepID=A0AAD4TL25_9MAGN|nr:hypothetical protein MKW98_022105 [Papaver atlanticum]
MKRPREEDCLAYIKSVQKTSKFNEFLQVMKEFKSLPTYDATNLVFVTARIKQNRKLTKSTKRVKAGEGDYHEDYKFSENIIRKEKFKNPDEYKKYLKCLYLYSKKIISEGELIDMVGDLLEYGGTSFPSTENKDEVQSDPQKDERETGFEASTSKRRKLDEPRVDRLSNCEVVNPSYQLSTERILTSGRTELGVAVLNDSWVSADSTPEGDSSDTCHFKKNVYEKNLFKFEDDRCERDRQFELVKGTIECVQELLRDIADNTIDAESICIKDHLKVLQLGCIKRLYGESWQGVEDALPKNAVPVLHDILTQLQKKMKEVTSRLSQQDTTSSSSKDDDTSTSTCPNLLAEPTT